MVCFRKTKGTQPRVPPVSIPGQHPPFSCRWRQKFLSHICSRFSSSKLPCPPCPLCVTASPWHTCPSLGIFHSHASLSPRRLPCRVPNPPCCRHSSLTRQLPVVRHLSACGGLDRNSPHGIESVVHRFKCLVTRE